MGIFKAYDVRGVVPTDLDANTAFKIGWGFGKLLSEDQKKPRVAVGMDARPHSPWIAAGFMDGLAAAGAAPEFIGPCSTPMLYWAVAGREQKCHGGAMITASHNPARYNGIKFCREDAVPVSAETGLQDIHQEMAGAPQPPAFFSNLPVVALYDPAINPAEPRNQTPFGLNPSIFAGYSAHVTRFAKRLPENFTVAVDTANGMGGLYLSTLRALGLKLIAINTDMDGTFPVHEANPSKLANLKPLCALVKSEKARLGIAFDGDADRAVFVDEAGTPVGQDMVTALLAREFLAREKNAAILYDLRSSRAVPEIITADGGRAIRERVGHSYMKATMRKVGCVFGGELAGHYYFRDNFYADSAIITVIEVLNALGRKNEPLSALIKPLRRYQQTGEINFRVSDKEEVFQQAADKYGDGKIDYVDGVTVQFDDWWFNLRASNTEPVVRLNLEARTRELLSQKFGELRGLLGEPLE
ncbi:MAG: phosphomannomutase/phosphoglucomutase [Planctomycetes bacterium]|nr:phosphomannomutase/phosphoglucomutase [Planctomycetota bacterium]